MDPNGPFNQFFYKQRVPFGLAPIAFGLLLAWFTRRAQLSVLVLLLGLLVLGVGLLLRFWVASYNWTNIDSDLPRARQGLITRGPYRLCRHPLYLAMIVMTVGFALTFSSLHVLLVMAVPTLLLHLWQIRFEEAHLERIVGPSFQQYRREVPMLVPLGAGSVTVAPFGKPNWKLGLRNDMGPIFGAFAFIGFALLLLPFLKPNFAYLAVAMSLTVAADVAVVGRTRRPRKDHKKTPSTAPPFVLLSFLRRALFRPERTLERILLPSEASAQVVDLGCGPGFYTLPLARMIRGRVVAVDVRRKMLDLVERRSRRARIPNIHCCEASSESLPLEDRSVDAVLMFLVLGEVVDPSGTVGEIRRVLKHGGAVYVLESVFDDHYQLSEEVTNLFGAERWSFEMLERKRTYYLLRITKDRT